MANHVDSFPVSVKIQSTNVEQIGNLRKFSPTKIWVHTVFRPNSEIIQFLNICDFGTVIWSHVLVHVLVLHCLITLCCKISDIIYLKCHSNCDKMIYDREVCIILMAEEIRISVMQLYYFQGIYDDTMIGWPYEEVAALWSLTVCFSAKILCWHCLCNNWHAFDCSSQQGKGTAKFGDNFFFCVNAFAGGEQIEMSIMVDYCSTDNGTGASEFCLCMWNPIHITAI